MEYSSRNAVYEDFSFAMVAAKDELSRAIGTQLGYAGDAHYNQKQLEVTAVTPGGATEKAGVAPGWVVCSINYTSEWGSLDPNKILTKFNPPFVIGFASPSV